MKYNLLKRNIITLQLNQLARSRDKKSNIILPYHLQINIEMQGAYLLFVDA